MATTEDSTDIIRREFQRFLLDLPYEQLRVNALTDKLEVADEMSRIAQGICFGCVLFYSIFESQNFGTEGADLMSHLLQLLNVYEEFRARYQERCQFLEERENNQSFRHLDGHHKLVRWRLVIHGAIDGFSRTIVFLKCSNNNEAGTVLDLFTHAIHKFNVPYRIRCDHGTENIYVARWMLTRYGDTHHPVITGLSVHNQRIERLWRDVGDCFGRYYKSLFYFMEEQFILDPLNEIHLYAFNYIFIPRISRSLEEFVLQWNNHPIRTADYKSPVQIWTEGFYQGVNSNQPSIRKVLDDEIIDPLNYGTDDNEPQPELQTENHVVIPRSTVCLNDQDRIVLELTVNPLHDDGNHGIHLFLQTVHLITNFTDTP